MSETPFEIKHGIVVVSSDPRAIEFALQDDEGDYIRANGMLVVHFCGYESPPQPQDFENLKEELETDQEFCFEGMPFEMFEATPDCVEFFKDHVPCDPQDEDRKPTIH